MNRMDTNKALRMYVSYLSRMSIVQEYGTAGLGDPFSFVDFGLRSFEIREKDT